MITINNVYFPIQAALDGLMIAPMLIACLFQMILLSGFQKVSGCESVSTLKDAS